MPVARPLNCECPARKLRERKHARSVMDHKTKTDSWTWIPANPPRQRLSRMLGAVVLAVTFLTAGVVLGRMSVTDLGPRVHNRLPSAVEPSPGPAPQPPPLRAATNSAEPQPTMALKSEPDREGSSAAASPPNPAVLLNPGTVKTRDFTEEKAKGSVPAARGPANNVTIVEEAGGSNPANVTSADNNHGTSANSKGLASSGRRTRWQSVGTKGRPTLLGEQSAPRAPAPSVSRDYQDLRAYMLAR